MARVQARAGAGEINAEKPQSLLPERRWVLAMSTGRSVRYAVWPYYRLRSSAEIDWTLQRNIQYLDDYWRFDALGVAAETREIIETEVSAVPGLRLSDLFRNTTESTRAFTRFMEIAVLRLLTTPAAMDGKPLSMDEAWQTYGRLFGDDRVTFMPEPAGVEARFREYAAGPQCLAEVVGRCVAAGFCRNRWRDGHHFRPCLGRGAHCLAPEGASSQRRPDTFC